MVMIIYCPQSISGFTKIKLHLAMPLTFSLIQKAVHQFLFFCLWVLNEVWQFLERDVEKLVGMIDFTNSTFEIISIVGSPGIGKSSLAIYVGNELILNRAVVHYVNMAEFPDGQLKQVLAEKIFQNFITSPSENITFDKLLAWASNRYWNNLIVLDNCDDCINSQRYPFQEAIEQLLLFSDSNIKFLVTSREEASFSEPSYAYKVKPLSEDSACKLLARKIHLGLNETEKREIAELTGEMPLALQVIGSLLNVKVAPPTPEQIITKLKTNPIPTLSPPKLTRSMQLNYSTLTLSCRKLAGT